MLLTALGILKHNMEMQWMVEFHEEFAPEFRGFSMEIQDALFTLLIKLRRLDLSLVGQMLTP
ncbi:MAG: hypothetical protein ABR906_08360 [Terracidiphilus sp.]|jgi:hypothetical protein